MTDKILTPEQVAEIQSRHDITANETLLLSRTVSSADTASSLITDRAALLASHEALRAGNSKLVADLAACGKANGEVSENNIQLRAQLDAAHAELARLRERDRLLTAVKDAAKEYRELVMDWLTYAGSYEQKMIRLDSVNKAGDWLELRMSEFEQWEQK